MKNNKSIGKIFFSNWKFLCLFLFAGLQMIQAQNTQIKGVVKADDGEPLPGVTVVLTGTPIGTSTDFDGNYMLNLLDDAKSITFSYLGFKTQTVAYTGQKEINVTLEADRSELEEVVVVGYGTQKAKDVTGAVTKVKAEAVERTTNQTIEQALTGRIAGLNTVSSDGSLGAGVRIRIRGGTSLAGSNEPLYVIDGLPVEADYDINDYTSAIDGPSSSPLANLDPGNIESIEILKDASAAAIYGARGANGVVMITTKSGKAGKTKISFDSSIMMSVVPRNRYIDVLNTSDYGRNLINQRVYANGGYNPNVTDFSVEANGERQTVATAEEAQALYDSAETTDWQDRFFRMGIISNHSLNASGGSDGNLFAVRGAVFHNEGTVANSYFKRYNFNLNNQYKLSDKLKLKTILSPSYSEKVGATSGGSFSQRAMGSIVKMLSRQPNRGVGQLVEDEAEDVGVWLDPISEAQRTRGKTTTYGLIGNAMLTYEFMKGLTFSVRGSGNYNSGTIKNYYPSDFGRGYQQGGIGTRYHYTQVNLNLQNLVNYNFNFGAKKKHRLNALLGYTYTSITNDSERLESTNFDIESTGYDGLQYGTNPDRPVTSLLKKVMISYLSRVNFTLSKRYNFTYSYRNDSSSVFPKNKSDGFHSGAFAWNAHQEPFLRNLKNLSNLKFRLSYGQTGNAGIPYYRAQAALTDAFVVFGGNPTAGLASQTLANENIKWESTDQYDAGIDLGLFDHRLNLTVDAYYKKTNDLLLNQPLPTSTGFTSYLTNAGNIENRGLEVALKTINIDKEFKWTTEVNFAMNRNKVLSLGNGGTEQTFSDQFSNGESTGILRVGESLGTWFGFQTAGVFNYNDFEDDKTTLKADVDTKYGNPLSEGTTGVLPGDVKYVDVNQDGVINDDDRTIIARTQPKHFGSLYNQFSYKGFEFGLFFTYKYDFDVINGNKHRINGTGGANWNKFGDLRDAWTVDNPNGTAPRPDYVADKNFTDRVVEDGSFIRLQSINIAYNIPRKEAKKLGVESLKLYSNMDNVYIWTKYSGYDPEVSIARGQRAITSANLDYGAYPRTFNLSLGLKVGF